MTQSRKSGDAAGTHHQPDEKQLDKAIDDTFPASDPVAGGSGKASKPKVKEDASEKELDDALEDTFPASDPLPLHDPDQPKH